MINVNKPKTIMVTLLTCVALSAHAALLDSLKSAGDDGNPNTKGNVAAAKSSIGSTFKIYNKSNNAIQRVVILNQKGQSIYNDKFACGLDQKCNLILKNVNLTSGLTFKFYDSKKNLVSAYLMNNKPGALNMVVLDDKWLGLYAFNQMVKVTKKTPEVLNTKLMQFFNGYNSPDGAPDIFEELGLYFIAQNGGTNENGFYNNLNTRLDNNQFLSSQQKNKKRTIRKTLAASKSSDGPLVGAAAQGSSNSLCDVNGLDSTFNYIGTISSFIPIVGDGVSAIFQIGNQIYSDACAKPEADTQWIGDKFAEIDNKLQQFNVELANLKFSVDALAQYVNTIDSQNKLATLDTNYSHLSTDYFNVYTNLADTTSLVDYVAKNGGLKTSYANSQQLQLLLSKIPTQLNDFDKILSNDQITMMKRSLDKVCSDSDTITGDAISTRIGCNIATTKAVSTIDSSAIRMKSMLSDEIKVIVEAIKLGKVDASWLKANVGSTFMINGTNTSWDKATEVVNKIIDDKIKFVNDTLVGTGDIGTVGSKLYIPLKEFNSKLEQEMVSILDCASDSNPKMPAILEWYPHTADNNPYAVTLCNSKDKNGVTRKVKSHFYYKENKGSVGNYNYVEAVNVMGVLVPSIYFSSNENMSKYPTSDAYAGDYAFIRMVTPKSFEIYNGDVKLSTIDRIINPTAVKIYNEEFKKYDSTALDYRSWYIIPDGGEFMAKDPKIPKTGAVNSWFTSEMSEYYIIPYPTKVVPRFTIMLNYVDPNSTVNNGLSTIWGVNFSTKEYTNIKDVASSYNLRCMTLDCKASGKYLTFDGGKRKVMWQNVPGALHEDYVILNIDGVTTPALKK